MVKILKIKVGLMTIHFSFLTFLSTVSVFLSVFYGGKFITLPTLLTSSLIEVKNIY